MHVSNDDAMFTPERHLPTLGRHGHSPQRHTAASTAAPTTGRHGEHSPTARQPHSNGLCPRVDPKEGPGSGSALRHFLNPCAISTQR